MTTYTSITRWREVEVPPPHQQEMVKHHLSYSAMIGGIRRERDDIGNAFVSVDVFDADPVELNDLASWKRRRGRPKSLAKSIFFIVADKREVATLGMSYQETHVGI